MRSAASLHSKKKTATHWKTTSSSAKPHMANDSARSVSKMSISSPRRICPLFSCGAARVDSEFFARCSSAVLGLPARCPCGVSRTLCRMCASLVMLCASSWRARYLVRTSCIVQECALVPLSGGSRECSTSRGNDPYVQWPRRASCEARAATPSRPLPVLLIQEFPSSRPLTNAANTDMKGCPI